LRSNFAVYYGQFGPGSLSGILNPVGAASVSFPWNDANGDRFVTLDEVTLERSALIAFSGNYDPDNPTALGTPNSVDPSLGNERTREFTVSVDHLLRGDMAVSATYIYRKYDGFRYNQRQG